MKVLISLSSFGAAETGRHGQLWCTDLAQQAGADGVEVRGELLRDATTELPALAADTGVQCLGRRDHGVRRTQGSGTRGVLKTVSI